MDIHELHDKLFEILTFIDDVCKKENIPYFLDGGTEIGALREKDFIPWDDDADIQVMTEDWPRFKAAISKYLPDYYHILEPIDFAPHFYDFSIRIFDDRYLLREEKEEEKYYQNLQNRVGVDIFLFSKTSKNAFSRRFMMLKAKILYGFGMSKRFAIHDEGYSTLQRMEVKVLKTIGKMFSAEWICKKWFELSNQYNEKESKYRFPVNYLLREMDFFPAYYWDRAEMGEIRKKEFPVAGEYDALLTSVYGDWRTPKKVRDDGSEFVTHLR